MKRFSGFYKEVKMNGSDMQILMDIIDEKYAFNKDNYPSLGTGEEKVTTTERRNFAVCHSLLHMNKSIGKIAGECEEVDHGGEADIAVLKEATIKMLINTLKLASELGMTGVELYHKVPKLLRGV